MESNPNLNYKYWCQQVPIWELHEFCFLLSDVSPTDYIDEYEHILANRNLRPGHFYFALRKCVMDEESLKPYDKRILHINFHTKKRIREWIEIAQKYKFPVPEPLLNAIEEFTPKSTAASPPKTEKPLSTKERDTLLKMAVGMAAAWYGYDPKASKSSTVTEIVSDLQRVGITLSDDTVRKWLNEASEFLPQELEKA